MSHNLCWFNIKYFAEAIIYDVLERCSLRLVNRTYVYTTIRQYLYPQLKSWLRAWTAWSLLFSDLSTGALEYRCTTRKLPLCNGTIIVLKITLLHSVSVFTNFVIPKRDRQTKKHHTFSSTAGARPTIPTILGMVIEEVRPVFAPPELFWSDQ